MKPAADATSRKPGRPRKNSVPVAGRAPGRPGPAELTVGPEALVEMTLALLSESSPAAITRASLARHAKVDPGLIRYYFKDRDSLMRTAAESLTRTLQRRGAAAIDQADLSPAELICARVHALLAFKIENPFYHRLMMEEMARSPDAESRTMFSEISGGAITRYSGYLQAGVDDGSLRDVDPGFLYMAIIGLCDYFVIAAPALADHLTPDESGHINEKYAAFICDLLLNGLRPR